MVAPRSSMVWRARLKLARTKLSHCISECSFSLNAIPSSRTSDVVNTSRGSAITDNIVAASNTFLANTPTESRHSVKQDFSWGGDATRGVSLYLCT
ncbi:hypothetical protein VTL71DRAFT_8869 [Oculimacula yallundae]|uniref:Uncharacterized protein n=1 Tax=Oculimacula yallundae TaxID=86028 RepID=A0ABR4BT38_9HELO